MKKTTKCTMFLAVFLFLTIFLIPKVHAAKPSDYGLKEGDMISAIFSDDPDVYIINDQGYKRLFLNQTIFSFYGHLGGFVNVKLVTPQIRDAFPTSSLFRDCEDNDQKVYGFQATAEDSGLLHWVNTSGDKAVIDDSNFFKKVFCINNKEFDWYQKGTVYNSVNEIPVYNRDAIPTPLIFPTPITSAAPVSGLIISQPVSPNFTLPDGTVGENYNYQFSASGGTPPYRWGFATVYDASVGTMNPQTGLFILGNQPAGSYSTNIRIADASGRIYQHMFYFTIVQRDNTPAVSLYLYNLTNPSRNPVFHTGDLFRIALFGTPNQTIKSCYIFNGNSGCDDGNYTFNSSGTWNMDSQVLGISVGSWSRWVEVGGLKSNVLNYSVVNN